jgi:hypothetical protein
MRGGLIAAYAVARVYCQVCSALRAAGVKIPIVAMTGNVDPASIEVFKRAGFTALLAKPFGEVRTPLLPVSQVYFVFVFVVAARNRRAKHIRIFLWMNDCVVSNRSPEFEHFASMWVHIAPAPGSPRSCVFAGGRAAPARALA